MLSGIVGFLSRVVATARSRGVGGAGWAGGMSMGVGGGGGGVRRVSVTVQAPFALVAVEGQGTSEREDATFAICDVNATCPCALDPTYKTNHRRA